MDNSHLEVVEAIIEAVAVVITEIYTGMLAEGQQALAVGSTTPAMLLRSIPHHNNSNSTQGLMRARLNKIRRRLKRRRKMIFSDPQKTFRLRTKRQAKSKMMSRCHRQVDHPQPDLRVSRTHQSSVSPSRGLPKQRQLHQSLRYLKS